MSNLSPQFDHIDRPEQLSLDLGDRPKRAHEQSYDEWLQRPDVAYHGSYHGPPKADVPTHFGPLETAHDVLWSEASYHPKYPTGLIHNDEDFSTGWIDRSNVGRIYARRLDMDPSLRVLSDAKANAVHLALAGRTTNMPTDLRAVAARRPDVGVTSDVLQSAHSALYFDAAPWDDEAGSQLRHTSNVPAEHLDAAAVGRAIPYHNESEGPSNNISWVQGDGGRSWEDDVLDSDWHTFGHRAEAFANRASGKPESTVPVQDRRARFYRVPSVTGGALVKNVELTPHEHEHTITDRRGPEQLSLFGEPAPRPQRTVTVQRRRLIASPYRRG